MTTWPVTLPQGVLVEGFGTTYEAAFRTFKPEMGRPIRSSTSTRAYELLNVNFMLSNDQRTAFWEFWRVTLQRGIMPFDFPHPILETPVEVEIAGDEPPTCSLVQGSNHKWLLSMVLRVLDET